MQVKRIYQKLLKEATSAGLSVRDRLERDKSVYLRHFDQRRNRVRLSLYEKGDLRELVLQDNSGNALEVEDLTSCRDSRGKQYYFRVSIPEDGTIKAEYNRQPVHFRDTAGTFEGKTLTLEGYRKAKLTNAHQYSVQALRASVCRDKMREQFEGCWLMADRPDAADDNAEHFYRYVIAQPDAPKAFFLLDADSPHWLRLEREGFRLIALQSTEHQAALVHGRFVISSQATPLLRMPHGWKYFADMSKADFVFLQHGIIIHDCSSWINQHEYTCFVTSTPQEHKAITDPVGPYNLTAENTILTGLPRHDALHARRKDHPRNLITIMPTWRNYLTAELAQGDRAAELEFTSFAQEWLGLLKSEELLTLADKTGCQITLLAHPNIRDWFTALGLGDRVTIQGPETSYQQVILNTAVCVTDYSSVAMDMATIDVPVVYFQFPEKELAAGRHTFREGYFDYARDGFGPVTRSRNEVLGALQTALQNTGDGPYAERRSETFTCFDGRASERIYNILRQSDSGEGGS